MLKRKNRHLPKNYAANSFGLSNNISNKANSLFPIGDYKGYGLGATVSILQYIIWDAIWSASFTNVYVRYFKKKIYITVLYYLTN